jgi:hypothetical protein
MNAYADLAERMASACAEAVDEYEIVAVLESDGVTDAIALSRYRSPDVFDLAARLCRRTPRRPAPTPVAAGPWRATPHLHLLRGVLFGLPALAYLAVSGVISGPRAGAVLVVSVLLSWATGQGLAFLGYVRLGWGDPAGAARVLSGGLLWATLPTVVITMLTGVALGVPPVVPAVAATQVVYVIAATAALVLGLEWWLLAALAPGVGAALIGVVLGGDAIRSAPVVGCVAVSVLAALAVAGYGTRGARPGLPSRAESLDALPHTAFGLCVGALLLFVPAVRTFAPQWAGTPAGSQGAGLALLLPLSLSMGVAEWLLYRYRAGMYRALHSSYSVVVFARRAVGALLASTSGYLAVLLGTSLAAGLVAAALTGTALPLVPLAGSAALGGALFVALLLMSFRIRGPVVAACVAALAGDGALLATGIDAGWAQLITSAVLCVGLTGYALRPLTEVTRHQ